MNLHEHAFVESFVQSSKRERVRLGLADTKKRRKLVDEFAHRGTFIFAPECLRNIESILCSLGAPDTCYLITEDTNFDGKEKGLLLALKEVVGGGMGTVISCLPARLGYFEGEHRERYILQR